MKNNRPSPIAHRPFLVVATCMSALLYLLYQQAGFAVTFLAFAVLALIATLICLAACALTSFIERSDDDAAAKRFASLSWGRGQGEGELSNTFSSHASATDKLRPSVPFIAAPCKSLEKVEKQQRADLLFPRPRSVTRFL
jgi:hypothetical protein